MKLTDALSGEHAVLYDLFDYVRQTVANADDLQDALGAVSVLDRLLLSHAELEEDLLFPQLEPHLGEMGPLGVMRAEHLGIGEFIEAAKQESDLRALKSVINQLLDYAHDHFQKEEMMLFAMAQQFLDEATLTSLGDEWAALRKVTINGQSCMEVA